MPKLLSKLTSAPAASAATDVPNLGQAGFEPPHLPVVAGGTYWLNPPLMTGVVAARVLAGSVSASLAKLSPCPIWVPEDCTVDQIACWQSVAGTDSGMTVELALSTKAGFPFAAGVSRLFTAGTTSATAAAGARVIALGTPQALTRGLYWGLLKIAAATSAGTNPTFLAVTAPFFPAPTIAPISTGASVNFDAIGLGTTAAIPSDLSTVTNEFVTGNYLWISLRVQ